MEALIGAIIGAAAALIGTWISTKHSARAQMNAAVLSAVLPVRLDAYRQFEAALEEWGNSMTKEACAAVYRACNAALLVSSGETANHLLKVSNAVRNHELNGSIDTKLFHCLHTDLILEMNHDLMHIRAPKIEENRK